MIYTKEPQNDAVFLFVKICRTKNRKKFIKSVDFVYQMIYNEIENKEREEKQMEINKKEVMQKAVELAKKMEGDWIARMALALKMVWALIKKGVKKMAEEIRKEVDEYGDIEITIRRNNGNIPTCTRTFLLYEGERELHGRKIRVERVKETEKAVLFRFFDEDEFFTFDDMTEEEYMEEFAPTAWLPKSQMGEYEGAIEIPQWLGKKKDIGHFCNKKEVWVYERG